MDKMNLLDLKDFGVNLPRSSWCEQCVMLSNQNPPISTPLEPCRVAPYVNLAVIRSSATSSSSHGNANSTGIINSKIRISSSQHFSNSITTSAAFSAFDPALISAAAHQYAAAISNSTSANFFPLTQYPLNLTAIAAAHCKSSSIADLRLKAKKHAESLGLTTEKEL